MKLSGRHTEFYRIKMKPKKKSDSLNFKSQRMLFNNDSKFLQSQDAGKTQLNPLKTYIR